MPFHALADERAMEVHLVVPAGYDDPRRPSGGNVYDGRVRAGLTELGWSVTVHELSAAAGPASEAAVDRRLARIPADSVVVVDGLIAAAAPQPVIRHAARVRMVVLVHMPGAPGGPSPAVLRAARLVVTTSHWTARTLREDHGVSADAIVVAPPGALAAELATGTEGGGALLCVGAVAELKGHDVLFTALAALAGKPWTCVCVGATDREPGFVERQRRALAASGIAERVEFTGPLVGADLERAYAAADVLVLPTRLESYGMVVTEALARGLPVIASSVGGVPEALGQAADGRRPGIMVEPDHDEALGSAIGDWLDDADVRTGLRSAAASRRARLGGWGQTVTTIARALDDVSAA